MKTIFIIDNLSFYDGKIFPYFDSSCFIKIKIILIEYLVKNVE